MQLRSLFALSVGLAAWAPAAHADDPCSGFKWDVTEEVRLFARTAQPVNAGKTAADAPTVRSGTLAVLDLTAQSQVTFAVAPGKHMERDDTYAGLLTFKLPATGTYRIAVDVPLWIDVVMDGNLVAVKDFQGNHACAAPHKIVEFDLAGSRPFVIQLSGSTSPVVRLTVTRSKP